MAVSPTNVNKGSTLFSITTAGVSTTQYTANMNGSGTTWPNNYVEASTFTLSLTVADTIAHQAGNWILVVIQDAVDVAGNYVTATGGSTLSTGVLAIVNLGDLAAGSYTVTVGNGLNQAGGSDSRNAALTGFGTFRIVLAAGNTLNAALRQSDGGGTGAFHFDTDNNSASGTGNLVTAGATRRDGAGGIKCKLTAQSRTAGNWGYGTGTITASYTFKSAIDGTSNPFNNTGAALKNMKVAWDTASAGTSPVKKQNITISSSGVISVPATNIDTDWGQVVGGSDYYSEVAVGQNFGDATTPAGEKAAIYGIGTQDAADNEQMAYVYQSTTQVTPFVNSTDTNRRLRTNTADQKASAAEQITVSSFSSSGRTTAQTVFRRKGPTITTNATPFLRVIILDAYGVAIPNSVSHILTVRTPTGSPSNDTQEDSQTLSTAGGAGGIDWNYTIANNHAAFNRFVKAGASRATGSSVSTGPDDPDSPPARFTPTPTASTTLATGATAAQTQITVANATAFSPGQILVINPGGGTQEFRRIRTIDSTLTIITFFSGLTNNHSSSETVALRVPVYLKDVRVVGNRFSGVKEPSTRQNGVFGVTAGICYESIWTGSLAAAAPDSNGVPTGAGQREQTLGAGSLKTKLSSLVNEANGRVINVARQASRGFDGNAISAATDNLFLRRALWNLTANVVSDTGTDLTGTGANSFDIDNSLGYHGDTHTQAFDSIAAPSDPSSLAYYLAVSDVSATRSTFTLTTDSSNVGFTSDVGNMGWVRQSVSFIAVDLTISCEVTPEVAQSDVGLTRRFGIRVLRVTADDLFVSVTPDSAPIYVVYGLNANGTTTQLSSGSATATANPSDFYVDVVIPAGYQAVKLKTFAKVSGSRTPGGDGATVQIGYTFDAVGTFTGLNFK